MAIRAADGQRADTGPVPRTGRATARPVIPGQGGTDGEADGKAAKIRNRAHEIAAAEKMAANHIRHLPIVDAKKKVVGMVSLRHVMEERIADLEHEVNVLEAYLGYDGVSRIRGRVKNGIFEISVADQVLWLRRAGARQRQRLGALRG